jgi:predicted secreted protein
MTTAAKSSFGVVLTRAGNVVAELDSIGGISIKQDTEDVTTHQSVARYVEKIATLLSVDDVKITGNLIVGDTLGQVALKTDMEAGTVQDFVITMPPSISATWTFKAIVSNFKTDETPVKGKLGFEGALEITGQPVLAITASTGLTTTFFAVSGAGTLIVPAPSGSVYEYTVNIATAIATVTITPIAAAGVITITANGVSQVVATGNPSTAITLGAAGSIVDCSISVQETGKVAKVYNLRLTRAA